MVSYSPVISEPELEQVVCGLGRGSLLWDQHLLFVCFTFGTQESWCSCDPEIMLHGRRYCLEKAECPLDNLSQILFAGSSPLRQLGRAFRTPSNWGTCFSLTPDMAQHRAVCLAPAPNWGDFSVFSAFRSRGLG